MSLKSCRYSPLILKRNRHAHIAASLHAHVAARVISAFCSVRHLVRHGVVEMISRSFTVQPAHVLL